MSYKAESLHPYIMNDRIKAASGTGGISNIPIASADTVGGIMIGGSANPITITGSGNASVRKATSELLGVVKAGAGVSVDADGAISGVAYSTTEYKTGRKWLDGRDVYEQTYVFENSFVVGTSGYDTGISDAVFDVILNCNAYGVVPSCRALSTFLQSGTLRLGADNNFTVKTLTITYVKPL